MTTVLLRFFIEENIHQIAGEKKYNEVQKNKISTKVCIYDFSS